MSNNIFSQRNSDQSYLHLNKFCQIHLLLVEFWSITPTPEGILTKHTCSWRYFDQSHQLLQEFRPICTHSWRNSVQAHPHSEELWPILSTPREILPQLLFVSPYSIQTEYWKTNKLGILKKYNNSASSYDGWMDGWEQILIYIQALCPAEPTLPACKTTWASNFFLCPMGFQFWRTPLIKCPMFYAVDLK